MMSTAEQDCGMGPDAAQNGSIINISTAAPNGDKSAARQICGIMLLMSTAKSSGRMGPAAQNDGMIPAAEQTGGMSTAEQNGGVSPASWQTWPHDEPRTATWR